MIRFSALRRLGLLPLLLVSACAVGPNYHRPAVTTPPAFKEAKVGTPAVPADGAGGDQQQG